MSVRKKKFLRGGRRSVAAAPAFLLTFATLARAASPALAPADVQFFEANIRPALVEHCYKCHSRDADKIKGGFRLDTPDALLAGGNTGPAIVPGQPDDSLLIQAIRYTDEDLQMPPKGEKLSDREIANFTEWVRRGAAFPAPPASQGGAAAGYGGVGKNHWAFQPVKTPAVPTVRDTAWGQSPVDNFVLAKLEAEAMHPAAPADRRTLIRRATFDLTGLPPTEPEIAAFLADPSPDAFAHVVDRLLASPRYGERAARLWLDVARYSDTKGDPPRRDDYRYPHAWTYRDYVIDAFNTDKPFNQFIVEQLAADRLLVEDAKKQKSKPSPDTNRDQHTLAALGFLTLGNQFDGRLEDIIGDRIDVTTKAFLGLTVACARCHDHKFDPIPTKDYYSLYGVFANSSEPKTEREKPTLTSLVAKTPELVAYMAKADELQKHHLAIEAQFLELRRSRDRSPEKRRDLAREDRQLQREIGDLESSDPGAPARANVLVDVPRPHDYPVLIRGENQNKGDSVPRRFLEILSPDPQRRPEWKSGSGRLEFAQAIASPTNPMTARVLVNRVWQQHFGEGFVATPDDLGNQSAPPTHPELLDWLAGRFVAGGWSVKKLHREILLSSTYQQSVAATPAEAARYVETDPLNHLLWRQNLRRLEFEQMHDSILAISGTLNTAVLGGKSVPLGSAEFATRRAVYTSIDRRNPPELFTQWDFPNPDVPSGRRYLTLVPQQALFLMNSPLVVETARTLTHRPAFAEMNRDEDRVASLYLAIFQRPPTAAEIKLGLAYVKKNPGGLALDVPALLVSATEQTRREQSRAERRAAQAVANAKGRADNLPPGGLALNDSRAPLDAWTKLAHALFQTNEAMFVN